MNPAQCGGRVCIRGMRIRVIDVLELLASGMTSEQIRRQLPDLEDDEHSRESRVCRRAFGRTASAFRMIFWIDVQLDPTLAEWLGSRFRVVVKALLRRSAFVTRKTSSCLRLRGDLGKSSSSPRTAICGSGNAAGQAAADSLDSDWESADH